MVQLAGFAHATALVELQLLGERVSMCQGFAFSYLRRFVGWGFINEGFWLGLAIVLVINEATVIALIEQKLLVYFAHFFAIHCLRILGVTCLFLPTNDLLKV